MENENIRRLIAYHVLCGVFGDGINGAVVIYKIFRAELSHYLFAGLESPFLSRWLQLKHRTVVFFAL